MNVDAIEAVRLGQARCQRTTSCYVQECYTLALDELLRHPENEGSPEQLLSKALAHARTHLRRRRAIMAISAASHLMEILDPSGGRAGDEEHLVFVEYHDWLGRSGLRRDQRLLLASQMYDIDPTELAVVLSLPVARVRERLARARSAARRVWVAA